MCCMSFLKRNGTYIILILSIMLIVLLIAALCQEYCGDWVARLLGAKGKSEAIRMLGWAAGGLIAISGIWVAKQRSEAMEKHAAAANEQATAANTQARIANEDSREKRFKDGVAHLGHKNSSVRLGGIYGLYQLAQDYLEVNDGKERGANIIDILCAHIRQTTSSEKYQKTHGDRPSEEIQSMLDLLFMPGARKTIIRGTNRQIDLSRSWLQGASLRGARLQRANLVGAQLQGADLMSARLQGANLADAKLQGAHLEDARLQATFIEGAQLQGAHLVAVRLQGTDLESAQLQGANLMAAQLQWAHLVGAQLQGADLMGAQLQGANLVDARLQGADLRNARLQGAHLMNAQLQGTDLTNTHLHGVYSNVGDFSVIPFSFKDCIQKRVGCESDLQNTIFSGGMESNTIEEVTKEIEYGIKFREQSPIPRNIRELMSKFLQISMGERMLKSLDEHLNKPPSNTPPSEAITGTYSQEEANHWIKKYEEALDPQEWGNENEQNQSAFPISSTSGDLRIKTSMETETTPR